MFRVKHMVVAGIMATIIPGAGPSFAIENSSVLADDAVPSARYTVAPPTDFADLKLATATTVSSQSVAANPKNMNAFVAVYAAGESCWVRASSNAGRTWDAAKKLPMPPGRPSCAIPAVTWAPDGTRVYAVYSYWVGKGLGFTKETGALVSSSIDNGQTWSSPKIAVKYTDEFSRIVSLKLAASTSENKDQWLYLLIHLPGYSNTVKFTRSANFGHTWSANQTLVRISPNTVADAYSPSIAAGKEGEVLVAWSMQLCDDACHYQVRVRHSSDHGTNFESYQIAASGNDQEATVAIGVGGTAHIVYNVNDGSSPSGIYYVYSTKAPYSRWSLPVALNDDISASYHYAPALNVSACDSDRSVLHVVWMDNRDDPYKYKAYYTRKVAQINQPWSPNLRLSGVSVPPTFDIYGFYLASSVAAGAGNAVILWGQAWDSYGPRPLWASRIAPGVSCP